MKSELKFPNRISYKLVRTSVILAFGIGLFMSMLQLIWDYRIEQETIDHTIQRILEVAEPPASRAVHILDEDLAQEVVVGLLQYDFVVEARIIDDLNIHLATMNKEAIVSATRWITKGIAEEYVEYSIPLTSSELQSSQPGRLVILVDFDAALEGFFDRTTFVMIAGFIRNILLVLALLIAFYWMLTRPLVELAEDIGELEPSDRDGHLVKVPDHHENDELGIVAERVNSFILSIRNLLEIRKKNEEDLLKSKQDLENRAIALQEEISEREKAQEEALEAKEAAELANRTKSEFLANMSHELRTPLNAVIGFSSIMKDEMFGPVSNDKYLEYCHDIHGASSHLLEVINDILDVSKIEVGEFKLSVDNINTSELLDGCLRTMSTTFERRGQVIVKELPEPAVMLLADSVRVKQILFNLLTNASKFTSAGGTISSKIEILAGNRVAISIQDTGVGIPAKELSNVLDPFVQVDNAFSKTHDGVGLGLSLCRSLMQMHEGELLLESEEGIGTKVTIIFPSSRTLEA
ncbi:sensor histidine kinase [Curvivirga aplysinae]|uniref:sensor histidine kinase n=1 Tax=Curvivirga aplysinae TaxID=2529852 RepID=UPI0012BC1453|nr:HAMP domain-containing sensor histidine kinase [Curvivirga aplysinae]MTI10741.1 HAMP domain-containing histidine kinase [Curvivirga aplysinae]